MNIHKTLLIILFLSTVGYGQSIIYDESFSDDLTKGATYNTTTGTTDINLSGVNWSVDISGASFDSSTDRIRVVNSVRYLEARDTDGPAIWLSPIINTSNFTNIGFSLEATDNSANNNFEASDTFTTEYTIDNGGTWLSPTTNGNLNDDLTGVVLVSQNPTITAPTIQIRVTFNNSANNEAYRLDNIIVEGTPIATPVITTNPNSTNVTGLSYVFGNITMQPESFTIQGNNLSDDITIIAPSSFEIATAVGGPYTNSITLTETSGEVSLTKIYTKLTYGLAVNSYNENITINSTSITPQNVNIQGDVLPYTAPTDCTELFISEYHEGTNANERYIELFNPTNTAIDLVNYQLARFVNGRVNYRPNVRTLINGEVIQPYSTYIIAVSGSTLCSNGTANYCTSAAAMSFRGNDVFALQNRDGDNIDVIGDLGTNTPFAQNVDLTRRSDVLVPKVSYISSEWISSPVNNTTGLGTHVNDCSCDLALVTWDGTSWTPNPPSISTSVILNGDYNTNTHPSFSACNLTLNAGFSLTVTGNTYIEVNTNVTNNGRIIIENEGSFVQREENVTFTDLSTDPTPVSLSRMTTPAVAWYEYTTWSSPIPEVTIENFLPLTPNSRRFSFNAGNFVDIQEEVSNTNTFNPGQDDIDDNKDVWEIHSGIMAPGVGYIATYGVNEISGTTSGLLKTFEGNTLNTGIIKVPVERNDASTADNNWNLIGNPYPSAIDLNAFFTENLQGNNPTAVLEGSVYIWSHNTPPSATTQGNYDLNFSPFDYVIINLSSNIAGEDGVPPNNTIGAGQGFLVHYSDTATSNTGDVTFTNSMRLTGDNSQFYKSNDNNIDNKLWLNLTSNNGVFNQISIAYVDGATNQDDGPSYDARRFYNSSAVMLVSFADQSTVPLAIQGRDKKSLDLNEVIPLGLKTGIISPTTYKISIDHLQGDFLTDNPIYLKDNLTNTYQDLTVQDYSFTAANGAFYDRFEIVFQQRTLNTSTTADFNKNNLSIIETNNDNIIFKINNENITITTIKIHDALGKLIYNLKGNKNTENYTLSNLKKGLYIATITLSNNQKINKKIIKK